MSAAAWLDALALPEGARVDRRVAKKDLAYRAPTAADRRLVQDGLDELVWVAVLKAATVAVPPYRDAVREYLEIPVLSATLRPGARAARLVELVHRAIPYPLVLLARDEGGTGLSLAHKRWSEAGSGTIVLEGMEATGALPDLTDGLGGEFARCLPLRLQPARDLFSVYQGWMDCLAALAAARVTGRFVLPDSPAQAAARRAALVEHGELMRRMAELRARAERETQISRRAELNLEAQAVRARLAQVTEDL